MTARVLEHRETEAETPLRLSVPLAEEASEVFEPTGEQRLLVGEMRVERGPADVRAVDDVLHGRGFVPLLDHHRDQGVLQELAGALDPPVGRSLHRVASFPNSRAIDVLNRTKRTPLFEIVRLAARCRLPSADTRHNVL